MGRKMDKFLLLLWKNWKIQIRHPIQTALEILAPVICSSLFILGRCLTQPIKFDAKHFPAFDPRSFGVRMVELVYSPENPTLHQIMENAAKQINMPIVRGFNSSRQMIFFFERGDEKYRALAGVQFDDSLFGNKPLPKKIRAILRFPAELRKSKQVISWQTTTLFRRYQTAGPRNPECPQTAPPHYYEEGFLGLQLALTNAIIKQLGGKPANILMQRFPYPSWVLDPFILQLVPYLSAVVMMSFLFSVINTVKMITAEKERQLKEVMKMMGLASWLHWTAWYVKTFSFLTVPVSLVVMIMKVPWFTRTGHSVFTSTNWFLLLLLLLFYISETITFCFMISAFFRKANAAAAFAGMASFLSFAPYMFLNESYDTLPLWVKLASSIFPNTAVSFSFQLVLMFEGSGEGLQWWNVWSTVTPDDDLTIGYLLVMYLFGTFFYLIIAVYVEAVFPGEFGVPKVWYFPFVSCLSLCRCKRGLGRISEASSTSETRATSPHFDEEPEHAYAGIRIKDLSKSFRQTKAVKGISLNLYEDEITVLLGHNGAGKTTTMSMLTGLFQPTSGTAIVGGFDIRIDIDKVRRSLGLCPQQNILFDELNVAEHIYFFSRLKGLPNDQVQDEINKYVGLLQLSDRWHVRSSKLSGGMKRKLCVGIALCAGSRVVMLDEPSAGMDPSARRALWNLLQGQKEGRTMLLTTHFMEEADLLGDRIAIMAHGEIVCYGSSFFLKKRFGGGYHLIIEKYRYCDPDKVTELLRWYIPDVQVESNVGSELSYCLNEDDSQIFEKMLRDLESKIDHLGIRSYGISLTTMEEVFMRVTSSQETDEDSIYSDKRSRTSENMTQTIRKKTGFALTANQILAMIMKKSLWFARNWSMFLFQIIIPTVFISTAILSRRTSNTRRNRLPELEFKLSYYDNSLTVVNGSNMYKAKYLDLLKENKNLILDLYSADLSEHMLEKTGQNAALVRNKYLVGATFGPNQTIAWFNNEPLHAPPLALALVLNAVFASQFGSNYTVEITNHPLPYEISETFKMIPASHATGSLLAYYMIFGMAFVSAMYTTFYVKERSIRLKHLQFLSGVNAYTFWISAFFCDMVLYIFSAFWLIVLLYIFQEEAFSTFDELGRVFVLLLGFGYCMLPLHYLASFIFSTGPTSLIVMSLFNVFTGIFAVLAVNILLGAGKNEAVDALDFILLVFPHYCLHHGMKSLYTVYQIHHLCESVVEKCVLNFGITKTICRLFVCMNQKMCSCDEGAKENIQHFMWKFPGIGRHLFYFLTCGTTLMLILILKELQVFKRIYYDVVKTPGPPPVEDHQSESVDNDVLEEKQRINQASPEELEKYALVLKGVSKYFKKFLAVRDVTLGAEHYECFGLLGPNGAGKTTTFKMMTGDMPITYGDVLVYGESLKQNREAIHSLIGYCPQFDALLDSLTGKETIMIFCLLKGISIKESEVVAQDMAITFNFQKYLNKKVSKYSGGNKRKLSTAIALIGDPPLVFLDEPTAGMDPVSKRHLWHALCGVRDSGRCIVLTSHSMEECEALCTRLAIMVNGSFQCLGSIQRLKNKYAEGYTLMVKVKKEEGVEKGYATGPVEEFIKTNFPTAILRERHQELITYQIKDTSVPWSQMFGIMERAKKSFPIEDYSVGQSSLEQVFLMFTKQQRLKTDTR